MKQITMAPKYKCNKMQIHQTTNGQNLITKIQMQQNIKWNKIQMIQSANAPKHKCNKIQNDKKQGDKM